MKAANFISTGILVLVAAITSAVDLDSADRWQIRAFYNAVYPDDPSVSMEWTGTHAAGGAGSVSAAWQEQTRKRINFFRTMAGIPGDIQFDPEKSAKAQEAALMMSAAKNLSHTPSTDWPLYSEAGSEAAGKCNLAVGTIRPNGSDAIDGYMIDPGASNAGIGHRRWLLYPYDVRMGNGDVPHDSEGAFWSANAVWVIPDEWTPRLETRDPFIAWPPKGHVPANLVYSRWSFSLPEADFSQATVTMQMNGTSIPLSLEPLDTRRVGEPTLVWVPEGMPTDQRAHWPLPEKDEAIDVTISNVLVGDTYADYDYTVVIFNPSVPGEAEQPAQTRLSGNLAAGEQARFLVEGPAWIDSVEARVIRTAIDRTFFGAEDGEPELLASLSPGYEATQSVRYISGDRAYHLAHPEPKDQTLTFPDEYVVLEDNPNLTFLSSLAYASADQVAMVEVSRGSEENWIPVWGVVGPVEANPGFESITLDLSPFAGQTIRLRFNYHFENGQYYPQTDPQVGWAIENVRISGLERIEEVTQLPSVSPSEAITFTPDSGESFFLQARHRAFGNQPLAWGTVQAYVPGEPQAGVRFAVGEYIKDPVIGWNFGETEEKTFSLTMGWVNHAHFPWLYLDTGWYYYQQGTLEEGLWLYSWTYGQAFCMEAFGSWFAHEPWDDSSWKTFYQL